VRKLSARDYVTEDSDGAEARISAINSATLGNDQPKHIGTGQSYPTGWPNDCYIA